MTYHQKFARSVLKNWGKVGAVVGKTKCLYDYGDGCGCAIGVNLTDAQKEALHNAKVSPGANGMPVSNFIVQDIIFPDGIEDDDVQKVQELQGRHDMVCSFDPDFSSLARAAALDSFRAFVVEMAK